MPYVKCQWALRGANDAKAMKGLAQDLANMPEMLTLCGNRWHPRARTKRAALGQVVESDGIAECPFWRSSDLGDELTLWNENDQGLSTSVYWFLAKAPGRGNLFSLSVDCLKDSGVDLDPTVPPWPLLRATARRATMMTAGFATVDSFPWASVAAQVGHVHLAYVAQYVVAHRALAEQIGEHWVDQLSSLGIETTVSSEDEVRSTADVIRRLDLLCGSGP